MVADLVRDDIRLREITRRAEPAIQLVKEGEIDVDLAIGWAVEGSHGGRVRPACRLDRVGKQDQRRLLVALVRLREDLRPGVLRVGEHL